MSRMWGAAVLEYDGMNPESINVEQDGDEVKIVVPIGPATLTVELPEWIVGIAVDRVRPMIDDKYQSLLDEVEQVAE